MMTMMMMMVARIIIIGWVVVVVVVLGDLSDAVHSGWGDDGFLHARVHVATTQQPSRRPSHLWACVDRICTCGRGVLHHVVSRIPYLHMYVLPHPSYVQHTQYGVHISEPSSTIKRPIPPSPSDPVLDNSLPPTAVSLIGWSHRDFIWRCLKGCV